MTGNTKVWRAPLAGLASVAMIATMGVAASTANAAPSYQYPDVKVTLDPNGGEFAPSVSGLQSDGTVKLTDARDNVTDGYYYADGVFEDLYSTYGFDGTNGSTSDANILWDGQGARRFSGWYTEKTGGQAVDPTAALTDGTTLYAHWSQGASSTDESEDAVHFDTDGKVTSTNPDGISNVVTVDNTGRNVYVFLADGDTLADWEVPSTDVTDYQVFDHWDGGTVATAKAGDTLKAVTVAGTKLTINRTASNDPSVQFDLYKDGVKATTAGSISFDVPRQSTLAGWQAITPSSKKLATGWSVDAGDGFKDYAVTDQLPDVNDVTVAPKGPGIQATVVRVHKWNKTDVNERYFIASGQTFTQSVGKALDDVKRANTTFLGWYDKAQPVTYNDVSGQVTVYNDDFFEGNLIRVYLLDKADPVQFSFDKAINQDNAGIDLYAGYDTEAPFTTITFDPNYSGADKISQKIYWGKKLADQVPSVTRSGYTLVGWYEVPNPADLTKQKLDTSVAADATTPAATTYYAVWSADSKYGVNGLLFNLARGYATGISDNKVEGKGYYASFTNSPSKPVALEANGRKDDNGVALYTNATKEHETSTFKFVVRNPGYVQTTWNAFVKSRDEVVVPALIKELKLAKDADIATVYEAVATKLSAEKADEINQQFAKVASDKASFPDVNYDDYGTHSDEITSLYKKGIVKGYADGTFGYGAKLARVDYIVWLYRAAGSPAVSSEASFSDVNATTVPNKDFRDAIAWAASEGITKGYADGTFAPYATLNRQDAMAFLYRAAGSPKFNESYADVKFSDVTPGDTANHSQAVLWAASNDIAKGYSGTVNYFGGYNTLVRQDAAAFLARTLDHGYID
ncbi:S-layer homology domain-containing protein [Bifidobacterium callitrichidarum]|uniref:SLH domain-containing protein n=1 Tax=Bifidobacterium callitrichidarum TaxID=2052941 RepID=A0A2U2N9P6_9BIFI|nr:S-layer homology domain-containing protein [Bifidobacterium callitrichidarum]PWG65911.1 hypothetical protein DF196_06085 [Bifidobacterium callitrichidarum]